MDIKIFEKFRRNKIEKVGSCQFSGKIFVIGLSGTGTRSLHHAFQMLGIRSSHYPQHPRAFDEYQALSDIPVACRFKVLDELYPGSKFIHTVRELDSWLENRSRKPADLKEIPFWMKLNRMRTYGRLHYERESYIEVYHRWNLEISEHFQGRDNLIRMNIISGDGWGALCPFIDAKLDREVPFPNVKTLKKKRS